ncbi:hypothetical protein M2283_009131 [Streptomyces pseudovenezuelae]|uniref:Transposase n=1 Tax=Streptomyces pseudovenezuelae TaxID=67350 RepID=A0ABT6LZN5_9ACTN|nr:hypothetical protein [Streptomyces pseudovenezuelae]
MSQRKLVAYLRKVHGWVIRIGREALRSLLARRGVTFQRTKTWKESLDPERETKLDRIEHVLGRFPDRVFAFDEFGPLGIRPTAGSGWAEQRRPDRLPATYHRTHGVRFFHGCYSVGDDRLWEVNRCKKIAGDTLAALKSIRAARAPAENLIHPVHAACWYSWRMPPSRLRRRMSRRDIRSGSVIGTGSGYSGRALAMP